MLYFLLIFVKSVDLMEHSDHTLLADSQEEIITSRMENVSVSDTASDTDAVGDPENPIKDIINQVIYPVSQLLFILFLILILLRKLTKSDL